MVTTKDCWQIAPVSSQSIAEPRAVSDKLLQSIVPSESCFHSNGMCCCVCSLQMYVMYCMDDCRNGGLFIPLCSPIKGKDDSGNINAKKRWAYTEQQPSVGECRWEYECV